MYTNMGQRSEGGCGQRGLWSSGSPVTLVWAGPLLTVRSAKGSEAAGH